MIKIACCEVQPTRSECKTRKGGIRYSLIPLTAPNRQGAEIGIPLTRSSQQGMKVDLHVFGAVAAAEAEEEEEEEEEEADSDGVVAGAGRARAVRNACAGVAASSPVGVAFRRYF